jgi:hypothetical protein
MALTVGLDPKSRETNWMCLTVGLDSMNGNIEAGYASQLTWTL